MEKEPAIPRRTKFLVMAGLSGVSLLAGGCKAGSLPLTGIAFSDADYGNFPALELATSLKEDDTPFSAHWKIDGKNGDWIFFGM
ncbi:MAG: hypothetical protein ABIJ56_10160, partial [Pseudomonadota bacterium]